MIDAYKLVLILVVYTAVLLLCIFYIYPCLKKLSKRKISISIQIGIKEKEVKERVEQPGKQEEFPSVLGKTKFVLRQPLPNAATDLKTENRKEKGDTFAPETKKPEDKNVNYETGEGVEVQEEDEDVTGVDLNGEEEDLGAGNTPEEGASGIAFHELGTTAKVLSNPDNAGAAEEDLAGRVLSENKYTELILSIQKSRPEYAGRITALIERYNEKLAEGQNRKVNAGRRKQKLYESDDFKNFNINEIS
jgi:hypothetical protein